MSLVATVAGCGEESLTRPRDANADRTGPVDAAGLEVARDSAGQEVAGEVGGRLDGGGAQDGSVPTDAGTSPDSNLLPDVSADLITMDAAAPDLAGLEASNPDGGVETAPTPDVNPIDSATPEVPADGQTDLPDTAGTDMTTTADPKLINGCTTFSDQSAAAATRTLAWGQSIAAEPTRCMKIKVGQTVTWNGNFANHPFSPDEGDTPTPITSKNSGTGDHAITFTTAGTFGYVCGDHPPMTGAIYVVP